MRKYIKEIVNSMTDELSSYSGAWAKGLLDSVLVKIEMNGAEFTANATTVKEVESAPIYALQSKVMDECANEAARDDYNPVTTKKSCTTEKNVISFKLNERYRQDILLKKTEDAEVKKPINLN